MQPLSEACAAEGLTPPRIVTECGRAMTAHHAVLVANNLRDIPTDQLSGKITLAVRLGDARTRQLFQVLTLLPFVLTAVLTLATPWCLVGFVAAPLAVRAAKPVRSGLGGRELIPVLNKVDLPGAEPERVAAEIADLLGTDEIVSMSVPSDGSYDVPEGIISSFPCRVKDGKYEIVQGLEVSDFSRGKIDASVAELAEEREALWRRISGAGFLSDGEKRTLLGLPKLKDA